MVNSYASSLGAANAKTVWVGSGERGGGGGGGGRLSRFHITV